MCAYVSGLCMFVFFFKQKTAYEMRISDWSSDVCSSDLVGDAPETIGSGQLLQLVDQLLQLGAARLGNRQLRRCGTEHEPLHRVGQIGRASCRERVCQYV